MQQKQLYTKFLIAIICVLSVSSEKVSEIKKRQLEDGIIFDTNADIEIDFIRHNTVYQIEAFATTSNAKILESKNSERYGNLNWLSFGAPRLIWNNGTAIKLRDSGFLIEIEMLTKEQKILFKEAISDKYQININELRQIQYLIPDKLECSTDFECENHLVILKGSVHSLRTFPYLCHFKLFKKSKEKECFDEILKAKSKLTFQCVLATKSKKSKQNTLKISTAQLNNLNLIEDLFGPANVTYLTRNQMTDLASFIRNRLNIVEEYNIPNSQFDEQFIQKFVKDFLEEEVPFEKILQSLSSFSLKDFNPDIITSELKNIFQISKNGDKNHIVVNNEWKDGNREKDGFSTGVSASAFGFGGSVDFAKNKEREWESSGKSLKDQLEEMNSESKDDIQWKFEGEKIVPKTIKATKLIKTKFDKGLEFNRIRKEIYEANFERAFDLDFDEDSYSNNNVCTLEDRNKMDKLNQTLLETNSEKEEFKFKLEESNREKEELNVKLEESNREKEELKFKLEESNRKKEVTGKIFAN